MLRLELAGRVHVDLVVAPAGQIAEVRAYRRWAAAGVEVIAGSHQARHADAGTRDVVAITLSVVVHVREATQQVAVLVAEGADAQVVRRAAEAGEQIQVGLDAAKLQIDVVVVRPELAVVPRLAGIQHVQRVDDVLVLRVELRQVESVGHGQRQRLLDEQVLHVELAISAERVPVRPRRCGNRACRSTRAGSIRGRSRCCRCACNWSRSADPRHQPASPCS